MFIGIVTQNKLYITALFVYIVWTVMQVDFLDSCIMFMVNNTLQAQLLIATVIVIFSIFPPYFITQWYSVAWMS